MKRFRIQWAFTLLVIFGLLGVSCSSSDKKTEEKNADDKKGGSDKEAKVDVTTTAKEMVDEFKKDPKTATEKYKGIVEVTGKIHSFFRHVEFSDWKYAVLLEGGTRASEFVECSTNGPKPWMTALPGQTVKIRGKLPAGKPRSQPMLEDCKIVDATGTGPATVTAQELSKAWASDWEGVNKKYENPFILEGEIAKVEEVGTDKDLKVTFKTPADGKPVTVNAGFVDGLQIKHLKAGQTVKLQVSLPIIPATEELGLRFSFLLD